MEKDIPVIPTLVWPELNLKQWQETYSLIHLWAQIIGKIKLTNTSFVNHWWNVTFSVSPVGLSTGIISYREKCFEMEFNFFRHELVISMDDGRKEFVELRSGTISEFYFELKDKMQSLGIPIHIWPVPVEMEDRTPFDKDHRYRNYDSDAAHRYWKALVQADRVMKIFRSAFTGKASPVHFFWGSLDLAVTFFSGKPAPEHPGAPNVGRKVMIESYNSQLASFGFWGGEGLGEAAFYSYTYPEPAGYRQFPIQPQGAYFNETLMDFILPYSLVRSSASPDKVILNFFSSAYRAAEELGDWDRHLFKEIL